MLPICCFVAFEKVLSSGKISSSGQIFSNTWSGIGRKLSFDWVFKVYVIVNMKRRQTEGTKTILNTLKVE